MDSYTFALALGGAGLVAMAASGFGHGHGVPHGAQSHAGHTTGHGVAHAHGVAHPQTGSSRFGRGGRPGGGVRSALLSLTSPRVLFSLLIGYGAAGVLLRPWLAGAALVAAAVGGAAVLELALARPLWNFASRFASRPAATLEGSLMSDATAASGFNNDGEGLVAIEVDGQIVQCLGRLRTEDRVLGVRVRSGDRLRVEDVDATRGRCVVSYVGHSPDAR